MQILLITLFYLSVVSTPQIPNFIVTETIGASAGVVAGATIGASASVGATAGFAAGTNTYKVPQNHQ